jgi:uncharacterized protein YodC (DUF2158 family)
MGEIIPEIFVLLPGKKVDMAGEIEAGMIVGLKSGGPCMTVRIIHDNVASCMWFDRYTEEIKHERFGLYMLAERSILTAANMFPLKRG